MKTLRLNDTIIKTLPEGEYRDSQYHFLYIRIGKLKKTWYFLRTINKKTRRIKLGVFPDVNTIDARRYAIKTADNRSTEVNKSLTLQTAYDFYIANRKPKSTKGLKCFFNELQMFHDTKLSAIKKEDIQQLYTAIIAERGHTGNRVLALIKVIISYAIQHGKLESDINGISTIKKTFKEQPRNNFLSLVSAKKLNNYLNEKLEDSPRTTLNKQHRIIYIIIKTLLFTGARKQNVLQMEKNELDLESGIWTIPPEKSKTGKEVICHLIPELITWLQKLLQENKKNNYVFINPKTDSTFSDIRKTWNRIQKDLDISATIHDLRRTCASLHVHHGASIKQIADTLGDASLDMVSRVYAKTEASIQRENVNKLSKLIND
jgi:integrase